MARPEEVGFSTPGLDQLRKKLQARADIGVIDGVVALVARHGKVVLFAAIGWLDRQVGRPLDLGAIFRIYSMTKPITAVAVMILYDEGYFQLDDPVSRFIPEFGHTKVFVQETAGGIDVADLQRPITIRHLLMHASGLASGLSDATVIDRLYRREQILRPDEPLDQKIPRIARLPLAHQPGSGWTYGLSSDVLGRLVEVVSGQSFDVFLSQRILTPLHMVDTGFSVLSHRLGRLVPLLSPDKHGVLQPNDNPDLDRSRPKPFLMGGGGLVSTVSDYARFAQMLLNGGELDGTRILDHQTVLLMTTNAMPREQIPFLPAHWALRDGYGMALGVRTLVDASREGTLGSVGSYTSQGAAGTDFWVDPVEDLVGVLMPQVLPVPQGLGEMFRQFTYRAMVNGEVASTNNDGGRKRSS